VQKTIKEKKECFRRMHLDRSADNVERYKVAKKTIKRAVSEARCQMYDGLYQWLVMAGYEGRPQTISIPLKCLMIHS
jgi:hypothetical protein